MKTEVEIISTDGVTLFMDTVIGFIEESDKYITVGSLMVEWREAQAKKQQKFEEVCDAFRVMLDEVKELRNDIRISAELVRAIELAETILSGPLDDRPLEQQPYYVGRAAGKKWREAGMFGEQQPVNPHPWGTQAFSDWQEGAAAGVHGAPL